MPPITTFDDLISTPGTKKIFLAEIEPSELLTNWNSVSDGLIGYWSLNDGTGSTAEDHSGNENDGTLEGSSPTWVSGISGQAVNFPGTNERVNCGTAAPLDDLGNGSFSISFWMKSKDTVPLNNGRLFDKYEDVNNRIILYSTGTANRMSFFFKKGGNGADLNFSTNTTPFNTEWNHIVLVINRATNKAILYMNTIKDTTEIDISTVPIDGSNIGNLSFGAMNQGSSPYEGVIDECRIYDRILTETEIEELYKLPGRAYYADIEKIDVLSVEEDGVELTEASGTQGVEPGYWYYENGKLYVSASSGSIYQKDIIANYKIYFGTEAKIFNNKFYNPFLASVPSINQAKIDLFWGISIVSSGQIVLHNHDGFFDNIYEQYAWSNKDIKILLGGEDLPYSEYTAMFTGRVSDKHFGTELFDLSFVDQKKDLETSIPNNTFTTTRYPNLASEDAGKPIPLVWGTVFRMPIIDVTKGAGTSTNTYLFKIADTSTHGIQAIDQVYVDGVPVAHVSADVSVATFKLSSTVYSPGKSVSADIDGYQSGTVLLENPIDVSKELIDLAGTVYNDDNFDTATVSVAHEEAGDYPIGLVVNSFASVIDILGDVMKSCLGTLYVNNDGKYAISIWNTDIPDDLDEVDFNDILEDSLNAVAKHDEIRKKILVGYRKNWEQNRFSYEVANSTLTDRLHGITRTRTIQTLLSTSAGATTYASRMQLMHENATIEIKFSSKIQLALKNINDRLSLTYKRRAGDIPFLWLNSKVVEIQEIEKDYLDNRTIIRIDDLKGIGQAIGRWVADDLAFPATYGGGTITEWDSDWNNEQLAWATDQAGFWCGDDGFADPGNLEGKDISRWW